MREFRTSRTADMGKIAARVPCFAARAFYGNETTDGE